MRRPLSMLALVTDAFGGRGGIAQYNRDFLGASVENGVISSITVIPRLAPDDVSSPANVHQEKARLGRVSYSIAALRSAASHPIDVVFCGHLFMVPLAAVIARLKGAKLVVQTHGIEAWSKPSSVRRVGLEAADMVLCVSRHTRAAVLSWASIEPERVVVVPNTVRDEFTPGDASKERKALGLSRKYVLLTVGRMESGERYKGQDRVISVVSDLLSKGFDVCYLVIGAGQDRERLEELARNAGVANRVNFLGASSLEDLVRTYRMADLFVMPSTGEGFGVAFLEAMASGLQALGLDQCGSKDALADGFLGTLVAEAELSTSIAQLLSAPKPDANLLAARTRTRFGRENFTRRVHIALERLKGTVGGHGSASATT